MTFKNQANTLEVTLSDGENKNLVSEEKIVKIFPSISTLFIRDKITAQEWLGIERLMAGAGSKSGLEMMKLEPKLTYSLLTIIRHEKLDPSSPNIYLAFFNNQFKILYSSKYWMAKALRSEDYISYSNKDLGHYDLKDGPLNSDWGRAVTVKRFKPGTKTEVEITVETWFSECLELSPGAKSGKSIWMKTPRQQLNDRAMSRAFQMAFPLKEDNSMGLAGGVTESIHEATIIEAGPIEEEGKPLPDVFNEKSPASKDEADAGKPETTEEPAGEVDVKEPVAPLDDKIAGHDINDNYLNRINNTNNPRELSALKSEIAAEPSEKLSDDEKTILQAKIDGRIKGLPMPNTASDHSVPTPLIGNSQNSQLGDTGGF